MYEQDDELDIELRNFFSAAKRQRPIHNEDLQNRILWMRYSFRGNLLQNLRAYPFFDRFRGALADLGHASAITGLATVVFIGAYLGFLAPEWS